MRYNCYRGDNIKPPPLGKTPSSNIWGDLENNKTPEEKFAREAREKILSFFKAVLQGKMVQNGQNMENNKTRAEHFEKFGK